ncbi:MAG: 23S rRNA (guanosine(2251)-2'-O)-methyltransferase RlmB [Bacteroidales bacterium]|nr:23S rRNA (guanosine(2251)-2'-O)-methyltransferase RlmB [Bacteroidales bacterium]
METFIFGIRPVIEAIKSGKQIDKLFVKHQLSGSLVGELMAEARKHDIKVQYVPTEKIDKISKGNNQGVVAYLSPISYQDIEDVVASVFEAGRVPLVLILDGITDVRNFGAIARTAECLGADAIIIPSDNSVSITEDAIKTSAGALYNIPVCKGANLVDVILLLKQLGLYVIAANEKVTDLVYDVDCKQPLAIVVGSEDKGVSTQVLRRVDKVVKIPMSGKTESLNVSVSAGMFIYEVFRQRQMK